MEVDTNVYLQMHTYLYAYTLTYLCEYTNTHIDYKHTYTNKKERKEGTKE